MGISVTPIPRLTVLTAPAFTLGTANAAGAALTSIASDSTILTYDTTVPTTISSTGGSAGTGSATTAARRDHAHGSGAFNTDTSCRVYANATQSIGDETTTLVTSWGSESFDTDTMHDPSSNPGRITIKTAGTYVVGACLGFAANTTGSREVQIQKYNGVGVVIDSCDGFADRTNYNSPVGCYDMDVDDYFLCYVWQNSGGSLNTLNGTNHSFWAFRIQGST
jgi:hypothetical protein